MANSNSDSPQGTGNKDKNTTVGTDHETEDSDGVAGESGDIAPISGDTSLTERLFQEEADQTAAEPETDHTPETVADTPEAAPAEPGAVAPPVPAASAPAPQPQSQTVVERRGPGVMALLAGGVIAAVLGYGAAYMGLLPGTGGADPDREDQIAAAIESQSTALAALQEQVGAMSAPEQPAPVDLSPVISQLTALSSQLEGTAGTIDTLAERVGALEARPTLTGEVDADTAAMAAAMTQLEEQLGAQQAENAAMAEEVRAMAEQAQAAMAEAEARAQEAMAEAEARAQASVAAAAAQAALSRVRVALASGDPFSNALSEISDAVEVPEALAAAAESGVPTLEDLQSQFPAAARAALPVALLEVSAEGGAGDRAMAFLRGQFAGRAVAPREGDDPDAILSRAQAAVTAGDLQTALTEIAALSEGAQAELSDWTSAVARRTAADAALDTLAAALDGAN